MAASSCVHVLVVVLVVVVATVGVALGALEDMHELPGRASGDAQPNAAEWELGAAVIVLEAKLRVAVEQVGGSTREGASRRGRVSLAASRASGSERVAPQALPRARATPSGARLACGTTMRQSTRQIGARVAPGSARAPCTSTTSVRDGRGGV